LTAPVELDPELPDVGCRLDSQSSALDAAPIMKNIT
jgi:hypothetical protein